MQFELSRAARPTHLHINAVELVKARPGATLGQATEELAHELHTSTASHTHKHHLVQTAVLCVAA